MAGGWCSDHAVAAVRVDMAADEAGLVAQDERDPEVAGQIARTGEGPGEVGLVRLGEPTLGGLVGGVDGDRVGGLVCTTPKSTTK